MLLHLVHLVHAVIREHIVKPGTRSGGWPTVRKHFLIRNGTCAACGGTKLLQVHHKMPFNDDPTLELHPDNLITLCMGRSTECHLMLGHGSSFKWYNPNVLTDASEALAHPGHMADIAARAKQNRRPNQPGS